ncbi:MAG TPA: ABC transporter substrate-binding protein [Ignavibacteria bacterium]|nr:ABC transporter substrate-binding protein [Ignavibacteria bacterium]HQY51708.1 ABC transporter substrate-binding protein [Ignavibacteria bacterium]HRA99513.1 ABC transporter substrate-binding protein [Ignavibacteria bacterium]
MYNPIKVILPMMIIFTLIFSSCGRNKETTESKENATVDLSKLAPKNIENADDGDWVIKQEMSDAEKLNPTVTNDASASGIYIYIFETLLDVNRETYDLVPLIAKSLPEISEDKMSYTFDLKEDVKFSDGTPLTGEDVIFTVKTIKNPFTDAQALRNYFIDLKSVELVDGNKYKVRFNMSKPYFRAVYALGSMAITPKHILDKDNMNEKFTWEQLDEAQKSLDPLKYPDMQKYADFLNSQEVSREPRYVVGSGPYKLDKWLTGQSITLQRNEDYWNKKDIPNFPSKLVFKIIQDQNAAVVAAKNKEVDYMYVIQPIDFVENIKDPEKFNLKKALVSEPVYIFIAWNNKNPLFADKKVRWALSYAIDRQTMIDKIVYGMGTKVQTPVFKESKYYNNDLPEIDYNPEKAKQLLAEAGWKDTDGDGILDKVIDGKKTDFKFTFINNNNPKRKKVMLVVIESLKNLGIQADLQEYEWSVFLDKTKKHEFDACYSAWQLSVTPEDPYQIWHSSQAIGEGSNFISYINPESDKLIEQNRVEFDDAKRMELLKKWQEIIYEDQPTTFLWAEPSRYVYSDRFNNTRWYAYPDSPLLNEWWTPTNAQRYKN